MRQKKFERDEIEIAKTYITGNLLLSVENSTTRMMRLGREVLYLDRTTSIEETVNGINTVKDTEVNDLISEYLDPSNFSVAAVGPVSEKEINRVHDSLKT